MANLLSALLTGLNLRERFRGSFLRGRPELATEFIDYITFGSFLHYAIGVGLACVVTGPARLLISRRVTIRNH